jgi:hypothetical protein
MKQLTQVEREQHEIADEPTIFYITSFREMSKRFSIPGMCKH